MTVDDLSVGDIILVPVSIGDYPGKQHLNNNRRFIRASLGSNQVVFLGEEELRNAKRFYPENEES